MVTFSEGKIEDKNKIKCFVIEFFLPFILPETLEVHVGRAAVSQSGGGSRTR